MFICFLGHANGVGLGGCCGVKNLSMGICDGAPLTWRSSFNYKVHLEDFNTKLSGFKSNHGL